MKNIFYLYILFIPLAAHFDATAQKEDFTWLLGGSLSSDSVFKTCLFDFSHDSLKINYLYKNLPFDFTNTLISDSSGRLLCYSNGDNLYNKNYEVIENGDDFYKGGNQIQGYPFSQSYLLLPLPSNVNWVIHLYGEPKIVHLLAAYIKFRYAIVDMNLNGGLGKVITRDIKVGTDTPTIGQITAVRHGNGRDWWVLVPRYEGNVFCKFLLTPDGLKDNGVQVQPATSNGLGQVVFSPDGQWYGRFNWHGIIPDSSFSTVDLYRFDRCSGLLNDHISKTYSLNGLDGKPGGIAFSNSSRYLYVSRWDSIFQYDLQAPDIFASEVVVATYDGFAGDYGLPTRFFTMLLAPDNKIYCSVSNYNSRYLHVIEHPDSAGLACQVRQHAVRLPVFNNNLLPNVPYYRLWAWKGSPCDTLGSVAAKERPDETPGIIIYPNPASDAIRVLLDSPAPAAYRLTLTNLTGQKVFAGSMPEGSTDIQLQLPVLPSGWFVLQLYTEGRLVARRKLCIIR